jgi:2-dehydro-3-deoxyphosphooctonate aldolase (KDO 8-P synthase)
VAAARTGKVINIKKGQFLSPTEMGQVIQKAEGLGGKKIIITERGTTFGYNNLVVDFRSVPIMKKFGYPIIFDATHSVQLPGGAGDRSGGQNEFVPTLAKAAIAAGVDGVFFETHPEPNNALSDGANMVSLDKIASFVK